MRRSINDRETQKTYRVTYQALHVGERICSEYSNWLRVSILLAFRVAEVVPKRGKLSWFKLRYPVRGYLHIRTTYATADSVFCFRL